MEMHVARDKNGNPLANGSDTHNFITYIYEQQKEAYISGLATVQETLEMLRKRVNKIEKEERMQHKEFLKGLREIKKDIAEALKAWGA